MPPAQPALLSPQDARSLLASAGLRAKKSLAQHFLVDRHALEAIVAAGDLQPDDVVVEVGPGLGVLTQELIRRARLVIAVELDQRLCAFLRTRFQDAGNLTIVHQDVLQLDPGEHVQGPNYKVMANLPYYLASAAIRHFLEADPRPRLMVVTVQREVALSMVARPGDMGILSVAIQFYGKPKIVASIAPGGFYPAPKVRSAVVRIDVYDRPAVPVQSPQRFFAAVRAGFSAPRKQLRNALACGLRLQTSVAMKVLEKAEIDAARRAETLDLQEWGRLYQAIEETVPEAL